LPDIKSAETTNNRQTDDTDVVARHPVLADGLLLLLLLPNINYWTLIW